jgi:uncharacterized protein (DUF305 family)
LLARLDLATLETPTLAVPIKKELQMKSLAVVFCVALALGAPVLAQEHAGHGMAASDNGATEAFKAANMRMHAAMEIEYTGNADVDFLRGMIPHHEGATQMARIILQYGQDAEIKALAEKIIADQESEIAWMKAWLAGHGQ